MKLIVGLGNPGKKFVYTRHNLGFMVVDKLLKDKLALFPSLKAWKKEEKFVSEICKIFPDQNARALQKGNFQEEVILVKPQTYMNLSGVAVKRISDFYKIKSLDIWVVHDDIDLPLGKIRIRRGGASAGHRGIESIIKELKTSDFVRFRLGIGRGKLEIGKTADQNLHRREVEKYVLSLFKDSEGGEVKKLIKKAVEAIEVALNRGIEEAMNRFN